MNSNPPLPDDPHHARDTARTLSRLRASLHRWPWRRLATLALAVTLVLGTWLVNSTPSVDDISQARQAQPSTIVFSDGQLLSRMGDVVYRPIALKDVPTHITTAVLSTEDARFREHHGIDWVRMFGAGWKTLRGQLQGGSTLTQQLARNLFPEEIGRQRSLWRKLRETTVALKIEQRYSKDQILEMYLNTVPFLYNVVGLEMAAQTYFDRPARELDVLQAATLVGMLKGSHHYNPVRHPDRARDRRNVVLRQMQRHGHLSAAEVAELSRQPLGLRFNRPDLAPVTAPHFVAQVRRQTDEWADQHGYDLERDGLTIETTLDPVLQSVAERAVQIHGEQLQRIADSEWSRRQLHTGGTAGKAPVRDAFAHFWRENSELLAEVVRDSDAYHAARKAGLDERAAFGQAIADRELMQRLQRDKTRLEAGFVAVDPRNGEVRAYVGSRDFELDRFDHVAQAKRQPGSTFKPFVYGAALQAGVSAGKAFLDEPIEVRLSGGKTWRPTDMSGSTGLPMTLREGLAQSKNTITVQVAQQVGLPAIVDFARAAGVRQAKLDEVPSLALGTSPVSLLEMAGAYATLANLGVRHEPLLVRRIRDRHGRILAEFSTPGERAIDQTCAEKLVDILRDVVASGTGTMLRNRFGVQADVAGKTGTTQRNTDAWFIAMQPMVVAGAWIGFNDPRVTMRSSYWGQGGHSALLIVGDFLKSAAAKKAIDLNARFPTVPHEIAEDMEGSENDGTPELNHGAPRSAPPPDEAEADDLVIQRRPGVELVVQRDASGTLMISDPRGMHAMQRSRDDEGSASVEDVSGSTATDNGEIVSTR